MEEKHASRLIRDLFAHKTAIFGELKRMSSLSHSSSISNNNNRPRAISTDESNRRAHMEERQRALLEKATPRSRATSPAPGPRGHRRDRSTGGPETRFPIASPTSGAERHRSSLGLTFKRQSLEVPDGSGLPPTEVNGGANGDSPKQDGEGVLTKRDSIPRTGARFVGGRRVTLQSSTPSTPKTSAADARAGSETPTIDRGVTLVDPPMND